MCITTSGFFPLLPLLLNNKCFCLASCSCCTWDCPHLLPWAVPRRVLV